MTEPRPQDPADRAIDAKADGAFGGGLTNHRAGYGDDKLARLIDWVRQRPSATLASGEGALLLAEIDRLRDDLHTQDGWVQWAKGEMDRMHAAAKDSMDHYTDARAEVDRLRDQLYLADQSARSSSAESARLGHILAALREPSESVVEAALNEYDRRYSHGPLSMRLTRHEPYHRSSLTESLSAAVAAAEREVGRE